MSAQVTPDASDSRSSTSPLPEPPDETPAACEPAVPPAAATASAVPHSSVSALSADHVVREYKAGEEIANSISHGLGIVFALAAIPFLAVRAAAHPEVVYLVGALVYAYSMLLEYTMSTLYHALAAERAKRVFKVLDHSGIYLLIAGTYTPYCLITLGHVGGVWLAAFVWAVSLVGIAFEAFWTYRPRWISAVLYVALGWSIVFFIPTLFAELAPAGFWLLVAGGISYTVGAVFYIFKKVRYMHSVFHLFVLAASCLQFFSVYFFVI